MRPVQATSYMSSMHTTSRQSEPTFSSAALGSSSEPNQNKGEISREAILARGSSVRVGVAPGVTRWVRLHESANLIQISGTFLPCLVPVLAYSGKTKQVCPTENAERQNLVLRLSAGQTDKVPTFLMGSWLGSFDILNADWYAIR